MLSLSLRRVSLFCERRAEMGNESRWAPRLGVVIPLANEEAQIDHFLVNTTAQLCERDLVFCVLDNVSRDGTRERVTDFSKRDPRVRLVWAPGNRCVVDSYFRGYREALVAGCQWILEMDGGYSHRPEEIPQFVAAMERGADLAAGSRFVPGGSHRGSLFRYCVSRGGSVLTNLLLGTRMYDMTSGFECFSRVALEHVVERGVRSRAHFFQTEIRYLLHDWEWVEIPINYTNPSKSVGGQSLREALRILWTLFRESRTSRASEKTSCPVRVTIVITTIQEPSPSVLHLVERTAHLDIPVLVLGDKKGPREFAVAGTELVSLDDQKRLPFELATALPTGHYCRKNLGYLLSRAAWHIGAVRDRRRQRSQRTLAAA